MHTRGAGRKARVSAVATFNFWLQPIYTVSSLEVSLKFATVVLGQATPRLATGMRPVRGHVDQYRYSLGPYIVTAIESDQTEHFCNHTGKPSIHIRESSPLPRRVDIAVLQYMQEVYRT